MLPFRSAMSPSPCCRWPTSRGWSGAISTPTRRTAWPSTTPKPCATGLASTKKDGSRKSSKPDPARWTARRHVLGVVILKPRSSERPQARICPEDSPWPCPVNKSHRLPWHCHPEAQPKDPQLHLHDFGWNTVPCLTAVAFLTFPEHKALCHRFSTNRGPQMKSELSRRSFLRSSTLAAAACAAAPAVSFAEPKAASGAPSPIKLGIATYTFRNFTREKMIPWLKELKVTSINCKDTTDHLPMDPAAEEKAISDYRSNGIELHAAGTIYFPKDEDQDIANKFEYCKRAGIGVIVAGDPKPAILPRIEKFVKQYDIRFAIHNHGPEDKVFPSPLDVLKAVKDMDPRMGCCIDVGHTARAGTDVVEAIHAAGPRLFNMHMKDLADFKSKESQVAVGQGKMPVREIFAALAQINYKGFVDLEYEIKADDPLPGAIESVAYMRGVLTGMGYKAN